MPRWPHGIVQVTERKQIAYYRSGGDKPSVVLSHGFTDNGLCWADLVYSLEVDYDVVMVDAFGHGLSTPIQDEAEFDHAADLIAVIEKLKLAPTIIIGHSMGGATACECAARRPDLVRALILEEPAWVNTPAERSTLEYIEFAKTNFAPFSQIVDEILITNPNWRKEELYRIAAAREQFDPELYRYPLFQDTGWRAIVAKITCPYLLLTGMDKQGALVSIEDVQAALTLAPQGEHHQLEAGHCVRRDAPDAYWGYVQEFLAKHS